MYYLAHLTLRSAKYTFNNKTLLITDYNFVKINSLYIV